MKTIQISKDLFTKLKMDRQLVLSIHSVYDDAINTVDSNKTLISLLNHGKKLVPMGIVLKDEIEFQSLKKYPVLTIGFTDNSVICLNDPAEISDLYLYSRPQNRSKILAAQPVLLEFLQRNAPIDSFYTIVSPLITRIVTDCTSSWEGQARELMIPKLKSYLQALYQNGCIDTKLNVFGFGRGLTPSSDDFTLGISAVLQYTGDVRLNVIKAHGENFLATTTFVSSQMLKNAWNGQYNTFLHQLFQAIDENNLSEKLLLDVISYGHTSGVDTLSGVVTGIELLKDTLTF